MADLQRSESPDHTSSESNRSAQYDNPTAIRTSSDMTNEQSPLLNSVDDNLDLVSPLSDEFARDTKEETKNSWYLFLLTICGLGLQMGWAVETSNGSPYLLSLGISKALLALVWIAGPLSGTLVQPYVGIKSDNCRSRWGKRRPFIMGGAIATAMSLMILAWAKELVGGFFAIFGANDEAMWVKDAIIVFAVFFVYILDFAINVSKYINLSQPFSTILTHNQFKLQFARLLSTVPQHTNKILQTPGLYEPRESVISSDT